MGTLSQTRINEAISDIKDVLNSLGQHVGYTIKYSADVTTTDEEEYRRRAVKDQNNNFLQSDLLAIENKRPKYAWLEQKEATPRIIDKPFSADDMFTHFNNQYQKYQRPLRKNVEFGSSNDLCSQNQEYYKHRDAFQGKPLPGANGYMKYSWPHDLHHIGGLYGQPGRVEPQSYTTWKGSQLGLSNRCVSPNFYPINEPPCFKKEVPLLGEEEESNKLQSHSHHASTSDVSSIANYFDRGFRAADLDKSKVDQIASEIAKRLPVQLTTKHGVLSLIGVGAGFLEGFAYGGPPCELCHKSIREKRCIKARDGLYHCWHFLCSFCFKILNEYTFHIGLNQQPYCNRICYERTYPPDNNYFRIPN